MLNLLHVCWRYVITSCRQQPIFMMLILMFSMAGVPPTVGFFAKLSVLQAIIDVDLVWLALVAVFFSIIGAFYYIRVIKLMYFDKPESEQPLVINTDLQIAMSVNGLAVLLLGLSSCDDSKIYEQNFNVDSDGWHSDDIKDFKFDIVLLALLV